MRKALRSLLAAGRGWLSAAQIMETFKDQPLDFVPGTRWADSNSGYQLLGYIVERVTNEPYPETIRENIAQTCGDGALILG